MSEMSISPERLKQIIAEEIRRDIAIGKVRAINKMIKRDVLKIPVIISENRVITFGSLMKHVDRKVISENESVGIWKSSVEKVLGTCDDSHAVIYEKLKRLVKDNSSADEQILHFLKKIVESNIEEK